MSRNINDKYVIFIMTLTSVGLMLENILLGWEFWVPPMILAGIVALWVINLSERIPDDVRIFCYFGFAVLLLFYLGAHKTAFTDIAIAIVLGMMTYSGMNKVFMMMVFLIEYFVILFIQIFNIPGGEPIEFNKISVSRILFHSAIVIIVYFNSVRSINDRLEEDGEKGILNRRLEENEINMEDFLSNISHELRTPVNVVNGMSDILLKRGEAAEAEIIKNAGMRLAYQIEDIQDYTECKRNSIFLEEEKYNSTSLINDIVTGFRLSDNPRKLELVVDMDPGVPELLCGDVRKLHKIFRHLLGNALKFTRRGGIYVKMYTEDMDYGVNLCIEVTDTGIGMNKNDIESVNKGMYQANKKRNRSSGGIGLGLCIVYGFAHRMGGFVRIESEKNYGTMIRVTIPQKVADASPCMELDRTFDGAVLFHVRPDKYKHPRLRDFYRNMAANLAQGVRVPLYSAETLYEVERLKEKLKVSHIFMGQEEYEDNREYFDGLAENGTVVAVSAGPEFKNSKGSRVILMPKPLYAYPVIKLLNEGLDAKDLDGEERKEKPVFRDIRALIVDDEPMNLVVATGLFREYEMLIDTADSGKEAVRKFYESEYDVIFMDHMMPEMDGVEAMKQIRNSAEELDRNVKIVALTANAVSGAREMFIKEGFDGFIAKPINTSDFERVMLRVLSGAAADKGR